MRRRLLLLLALAAWLSPTTPSDADVVFPARLLVAEIERGAYEVTFTLPLIEGRFLRAQVMLPPSCREVTDRKVEQSSAGITTTWQVQCDPPSLAGEAILIEGLLGTQTDLLLELTTLDGRLYSVVLKPSRPGLIVPSPPSLRTLAGESLLAGMRRIVRTLEVWVLVLVVTCLGFSRAVGSRGIVVFTVAHGVGQWLAGRNGLLISAQLPPTFLLLTALVPALDLMRGDDKLRGWMQPLWLVAGLLGIVSGGSQPETIPASGLSSAEQSIAFVLFTLGIAVGLTLVAATVLEIRRLLGWRSSRVARTIGYVAGIASVGFLVQRATVFVFVPTGMPRAPVLLALLAAVLGAALPSVGTSRRGSALLSFSMALGVGLALGLVGFSIPFGTLVVYGSLFLFGFLLVVQKPLPRKIGLPLGALAVIGHGWHTGSSMAANVSLPVASAVGAGVVAMCVFYASFALAESILSTRSRGLLRLLGVLTAFLAVVWRFEEYARWYDVQVATEAALGMIRLPLLALLLLVAAVVVWPRRQRVLRELGMETRTTVTHWVLMGLALFFIPIGTIALANPFFEPSAPRGDDARRVVSRVLWDTYHALNIENEDELYDRLALSVTGDLLADVYLDSRRRLTAGTREGAVVTVRDVSVVEVDDSARGSDNEAGFSYPCRWIVTARVRHLQHVHHRQNIYSGNLTIRVDDERWKIAGVELTSEERVVLPWKPT